MKRIFCFLLVAIGFLSVERLSADCVKVDGQVRYAFELKTLTQEQAQQAVTNGYVDLWTYACFDQPFVDAGLINYSGGQFTYWGILMGDASHGYVIVDKNGTYDQSGNVAKFAPPSRNFSGCEGSSTVWQAASGGAVPKTWFQVCPNWGYGSSSRTSDVLEDSYDLQRYCTTIEAEGKTWYCLKMYQVRFVYKQPTSFYVQYTKEDRGTDQAYAGTNFNVFAENFATQLGWPQYTCGNMDQSWSNHVEGRWGAIRGGVEVIADPEMLLTAEATCGGTDLPGKLSVNDWAGKTWADYSGVKFYVNKAGGTVSGRKQVSAADIATTPSPIPTTGDASEIAYTLTPSGYTMPDGSYADSLIWVIEDTFLA